MGVITTRKSGRVTLHMEQFSHPCEVAEVNRTRTITDRRFDDKSRDHSMSKSWEGVDSFEEAMEYLENGYQPNVEKLEVGDAELQGIEKRIKFQNDVAGFAPIVPLAIMGVPNCMINCHMKPIKAKVLDVYYDMTASCGTDPDDLLKAGQKMLSAILQLEMQGYKFNLYTTQNYYDDGEADMIVVKVKGSNEPLNIKRMSFALCHPAFFRVVGFDWYSRVPGGKYRSGYGRSMFYAMDRDEAEVIFRDVFGDNAVAFSATKILNRDEEYLKDTLRNTKTA